MKKDSKTPDYGNWVPERLLTLLWSLSCLFLVLLIVNIVWWKVLALTIIFAVITVVLLGYSLMMQIMHQKFSFSGGGLMGKMHQYLLDRLPWDGQGKVIDIGCGSGALAIRTAKKFPSGQVVGMDYWGVIWDYAEQQCKDNAQKENVKNVTFIKGDATAIDFPNESFDGAVSNFVFHEVRTAPDKRKLVKEALRVVKKGGAFSFQDMFECKRIYGDMNQFIEELKKEGISEIHYEPNTENLPFVPSIIKPMFRGTGLIYGRK